MKKIIITVIITAACLIGLRAYADSSDGIHFLRGSFNAGYATVESFTDIETGVVCYVVQSNSVGISCVKE